MYQPPKLNLIGDARDVILGVDKEGVDLDETHYIPDWEFGDDVFSPSKPWTL
jgi:hypothetical protein